MPVLIFIVFCTRQKDTGDKTGGTRILAIVEKGASSLGFYTEEGTRIKTLHLDTFPHEMRFSPDNKYAYITNNGSLRYADTVEGGKTISVVNLQRMEKEEAIPVLPYRRPHGIDVDAETGYLAVGVEEPDQVLLIDPEERKIIKHFDNHGKTPHMVTISKGAKWIYASNVESANVAGINTRTGEYFSIDVGYKPQESVLSPDEGILYVGCDEYISVIDLDQRNEIARIPNGANRMDLIHNGELLVFASTRYGIGFADAKNYRVTIHLDIPYKPFSLHASDDEKFAYCAAEEQDVVYTVSIDDKRIIRKFKLGKGLRPDPVQEFMLNRSLAVDEKSGTAEIPSFTRQVLDNEFHKGYRIKSADINGDKKQDLIAVSDRLPEILWFENPGWEKHILLNKTSRNIDVSPCDVDRDGDIDMALACRFNLNESERGGYIYWLENPGRVDDREWVMHYIDSVPTSHRIRWADVNGDGMKELINLPIVGVGAEAPGFDVPLDLVCYRVPEDPAAGSWGRTVIDNTLHLAHGLCIVRWDNDIREDILTASLEGINLYRSTSVGNDFSWEKTNLVRGKPGSRPNTGSSEISVGNPGNTANRYLATIEPWHGNQVVVYTPDNDRWKRNVIDTTFNNGHALGCVDLNYDGCDEIVAGHRGEGYNLYIFQYRTESNEWIRTDLDRGGMSAAGICIFDAGSDGWFDIAACGSQTQNVVLYCFVPCFSSGQSP